MSDRSEVPTISWGMLKAHFAGLADDDEVSFSGLRFYRVKERAPKLFQVEFDQTVYLAADGRVVVENHE